MATRQCSETTQMKMLREFGPEGVLARLGVGKTKFKEDYIDTGRARWVRSGRLKRMPEHEVDRLIAEDIAAAEHSPPAPPALTREDCVKGNLASRGKQATYKKDQKKSSPGCAEQDQQQQHLETSNADDNPANRERQQAARSLRHPGGVGETDTEATPRHPADQGQ
jgi:hypothetical protein